MLPLARQRNGHGIYLVQQIRDLKLATGRQVEIDPVRHIAVAREARMHSSEAMWLLYDLVASNDSKTVAITNGRREHRPLRLLDRSVIEVITEQHEPGTAVESSSRTGVVLSINDVRPKAVRFSESASMLNERLILESLLQLSWVPRRAACG